MSEQPNKLPIISFPGHIHLIQNDQDMNNISQKMLSEKSFGFDTETRPSFKKGEFYNTSLLQLSTNTDAYLVRLGGLTQFGVLKSIFENTAILKVGLAIRDDLKGLQKLFAFNPKNFVDLQDIAKQKNLKNFGLKGMTAEVLFAQLSKGPKLTNWAAATLTDRQLVYAATDAWIGLQLYKKLSVTGAIAIKQ